MEKKWVKRQKKKGMSAAEKKARRRYRLADDGVKESHKPANHKLHQPAIKTESAKKIFTGCVEFPIQIRHASTKFIKAIAASNSTAGGKGRAMVKVVI